MIFVVNLQSQNSSGGGEMVDTLLWGGSGSNPVRVRVSPTAQTRVVKDVLITNLATLFFYFWRVFGELAYLFSWSLASIFCIAEMEPMAWYESMMEMDIIIRNN